MTITSLMKKIKERCNNYWVNFSYERYKNDYYIYADYKCQRNCYIINKKQIYSLYRDKIRFERLLTQLLTFLI